MLLAAPVPFAWAHDDTIACCWLLIVTACSVLADYLYIGSIWNVVDRWIATVFTIYLFSRACVHVPVLSLINMFVVGGVLFWARGSSTAEQWVWRHSIWHITMVIDITFFLHMIYSQTR